MTSTTTTQIEKYPDAKKHKVISFVKSALRIAACYFLAY